MADKVTKKAFEVEVEGGEPLKLVVKLPNQEQKKQGQYVYNRTFREVVRPTDGQAGAIVRAALESVLRDQKLWDDEKQARYQALSKALEDGQKKLSKGGIKLSEGREIAIQMRRDRNALQQLMLDRNALDVNTAEAQAENAKFNYFVSVCTLDARTGVKVFKDEEDYNRRADEAVAEVAGANFANLYYGVEDDWQGRYFENKWLRSYKFSREDHRLVNKQGHLVDAKGRLINDDGDLVNDLEQRIDEDGNLLGEDGLLAAEAAPFLDDEGAPVEIPAELKAKAKAVEAEPAPEALTESAVEKPAEKVAIAV